MFWRKALPQSSSTLKMAAECKLLTTLRQIPEGSSLRSHRRENLKSCTGKNSVANM
jgi:hypothetical protein